MSYILDALKRADAERERGAVPGLHTRHAMPVVTQAGGHGARHLIGLGALAAALALGGLAAGLWFWRMPASSMRLAAVDPSVAGSTRSGSMVQTVSTPTPTPTSTSTSTSTSTPTPTPTPVPVPKQAPASSSSALAPVPLPADVGSRAASPVPLAAARAVSMPLPDISIAGRSGQPRPDSAGKAVMPDSVTAAASRPLPGAKGSSAAALPSPNVPNTQPGGQVASVVQTAQAAIPLLGELPEAIRRQIPPLAITGSVYSENRAQRMLLVNNQVLSEGSLAAPDVSLEEIRAKSSVFSFKGTRFRVTH